MKLVYCIAGLYNSGGMERVLTNKANYLVERGYEVVIVTTDQKDRPIFFPLDDKIKVIDLGVNYEDTNGTSFTRKVIRYPFKLARHYRTLKSLLHTIKADVVVSMFCHEASFLWKIKDGSRKFLEIHFSRYKRIQYNRKGLWRFADELRSKNDLKIVSHYDKFVVLTNEDKGYWGALENMTVIPNARTFNCSSPSKLQDNVVLAVGRYEFQKGYDRLISAWKIVNDAIPDAVLKLVGDGELREELQGQIDKLGLQDSIILGRATQCVEDIYASSSMLVLSSHYEGLPMVLLEAQAAGLPIVSFNCKCGPLDVIDDGVSGFLVEDGDIIGLADKIIVLLKNRELRLKMGEAAFRNSDNYDIEKIMPQWIELFHQIKHK